MKQDGSSLIEVLVGLLLIGVTLGILTSLTLHSFRAKTLAKNRYEKLIFQSELRRWLKRAIDHQDEYRLTHTLRIHQPGAILLQNGQRSEIHSSATLAPDQSSTAFTAVELRFEQLFVVQHQRNAALRSEILACPKGQSTHALYGVRNYLGLALDGVFEFSSQGTPELREHACRIFQLEHEGSMIGQTPREPTVPSLAFLVPIERIYTIYRAKTGALRYLMHVGPHIIESQPLLSKSSPFQIKKNLNPESPPHQAFQVLVATNGTFRPLIWLSHTLAPLSYDEFLFGIAL